MYYRRGTMCLLMGIIYRHRHFISHLYFKPLALGLCRLLVMCWMNLLFLLRILLVVGPVENQQPRCFSPLKALLGPLFLIRPTPQPSPGARGNALNPFQRTHKNIIISLDPATPRRLLKGHDLAIIIGRPELGQPSLRQLQVLGKDELQDRPGGGLQAQIHGHGAPHAFHRDGLVTAQDSNPGREVVKIDALAFGYKDREGPGTRLGIAFQERHQNLTENLLLFLQFLLTAMATVVAIGHLFLCMG